MSKTILFLGVILMLVSCRTAELALPTYAKAPKADLLIESVQSAHFDFNSMSAKISGTYEDSDNKIPFKGAVKIKKDSVIWITIGPGLGIELGRVLFDLDSMHFINRYEKTYYKSSYDELSEKIQSPLSFERIQDLLVGNSLDSYQAKKYFSTLNNNLYSLSSISPRQLKKWNRNKKVSEDEVYLTSVVPKSSKIKTQQYTSFKDNRTLYIRYDDFENYNKKSLGKTIDLNIDAEKKINLRLKYSKVNLNKGIKTPFKVPGSYETIH